MDAAAGKLKTFRSEEHAGGRWPSNVIHDGSEVIMDEFARYGLRPSGAKKAGKLGANLGYGGGNGYEQVEDIPATTGTASRFFYCAKASPAERRLADGSKNDHPTVKPVKVIEHLVTLYCPPGGVVLDPHAGSGTTGVACINTNRKCILIDNDPESVEKAIKRCSILI